MKQARLTLTLIGINVFLFLLFNIIFVLFTNINAVRFFAQETQRIRQWEQLWSLFTSMFIHADFFHLFSNMLALFIFGIAAEKAYRRWEYLIIYLGSGLIGSIFTHFAMVLLSPNSIGLGASGAIYGLMVGVFLKITRNNRYYMIFAFIYVFIRLFSFINFAHIFGALGGLLIGLWLRKRETRQYIKRNTIPPSRPSRYRKEKMGFFGKIGNWFRNLKWKLVLKWHAFQDRQFFRREKKRAEKLMASTSPTSLTSEQTRSSPLLYPQTDYEIAILKKFRDVIELYPAISISQLANDLLVTKDELYRKLVVWQQKLPFHLHNNSVIIDDYQRFFIQIDKIIAKWEKNA